MFLFGVIMRILYLFSIITLTATLILSCGLIEFDFDTSTNGQIDKVTFCPTTITQIMPDSMKENMSNQFNSMMDKSFNDIIAKVKDQDTWPADDVRIKKLSLEQTNIPEILQTSNTLGFVKTIKIYISYQDDTEEILFASLKNEDSKATKLTFEMEDQNIINYIDKGFKIRIDSSVIDCPSMDILIKANITSHIKL
jgi:hypothetical protein